MTGPDLRTEFINGMSYAAATVNVVTTDGPAGRAGVTVSAMSSVSADTEKPTLLVCIDERSAAAEVLLENGVFCVNILHDDQSYISDTFAGRYKDTVPDKFDCADWAVQATGAPRVVDPLVAFDCRVASTKKVGTHHVIFGEVVDVFTAPKGSPLIYHNRAYRSSTAIELSTRSGEAPAERLAIGCFHTFGPFVLPGLIRELVETHGPVELDLVEGDNRRVLQAMQSGEVEVALIYDYGLDDRLESVGLTELEPYVLLAEGHELAQHAELTPGMLADHPMISASEELSRDYLKGVLAADGIAPKVAFRPSSFEMVRGLVGHGLGFAVMMTKPAGAITYDGRPLVARRLAADAPKSGVVLAWKKGHALSPAAERFSACCRRAFCPDPR
ncbi:MAG: LysR substrate-binding domain-containing protein [Sphingomonadales bacterium]|nr:LysR substrate-binding domain-containing protein [Sphingomonadales bacterium]